VKNSNRVSLLSKTAALALIGAIVVTANGCFWRKKNKAAQKPTPAFTVKSPGGNTNIVMTPAPSPVGKVFSVNTPARFVVVTFPIGQIPANDTRLSVFRGAMKVGEIKITIPPAPIGNGVSADIISGSAEKGDEVRAE